MKIEMINEHQIRCTLTKEDLDSREIKLSELAYGSEKAKLLFHDMMRQAANDFGFEAEDIPLMIEAVPLSKESIMLIISKVDSPDELDTRFSNFTHDSENGAGQPDIPKPDPSAFSDISNLVAQMQKARKAPSPRTADAGIRSKETAHSASFSFTDMDAMISLAHQLSGCYKGDNSLYYDAANRCYHLILRQGAHTPVDFDRITHTAAKYLRQEAYSIGREAYGREHYRPVFLGNALQSLAKV